MSEEIKEETTEQDKINEFSSYAESLAIWHERNAIQAIINAVKTKLTNYMESIIDGKNKNGVYSKGYMQALKEIVVDMETFLQYANETQEENTNEETN